MGGGLGFAAAGFGGAGFDAGGFGGGPNGVNPPSGGGFDKSTMYPEAVDQVAVAGAVGVAGFCGADCILAATASGAAADIVAGPEIPGAMF